MSHQLGPLGATSSQHATVGLLASKLHTDAFRAGCSSNALLSRLIAPCASPAAERGFASASIVQMLHTRFRVALSFLALIGFERLCWTYEDKAARRLAAGACGRERASRQLERVRAERNDGNAGLLSLTMSDCGGRFAVITNPPGCQHYRWTSEDPTAFQLDAMP